jgi:hypothetical protein
VEIRSADGSRNQLDLGPQIGDLVWLDDRRIAVSPENGDHLVEIRDAETGELVQGIEDTPRISEEPGYRLLRSTALAWDPERRRLHTLDAFTGHYRVYDLATPITALRIESRIDDRNRDRYEKGFAQLDRQFAESGEFQGASVWRFSPALDSAGTAWMVERCELSGSDAASLAGEAHLLAIGPEGTEHRLALETACCSLTVVPWGDSLSFVQAGQPGRPGCFATVKRPSLGVPPEGKVWMEVIPLSPQGDVRSRRDPYAPAVLRRLAPGAEPSEILSEVALRLAGLALVCTGGADRGLACVQVWLDTRTATWEDAADQGRPGRPVTGTVALDGEGIPGASVALVPAKLRSARQFTLPLALPDGAREAVREIITDADGRFTLPSLSPGDYRLLVALPGGRMDQSTTFSLTVPARPDTEGPTSPLDLGILDFPSGVSVEVVVTGPEGQPLAGAEAGAAQEERADSGRPNPGGVILFRASVGDDGRAAIGGLDPDLPVVVTCRAPGHEFWRAAFDAPPPFVACTLDPLATIRGRVVDEDGEPLPDSSITLAGGTPPFEGAVETTISDEEGGFRFDGLESGRFRVVAASPGRTAVTRSLALEAGADRDLGVLALDPGDRWLHRVVDGTDREPVQGARLTAVSPPGALLPATTDAQGEAELAGPATGPLMLEVRAEGFAPRHVDVPESARTLDAEATEIVLERAGWIVARVWDDSVGAPCAGCPIVLSGREPAESLITDGSGMARSEPLAPGRWQASLTRLQGYGVVVTRSGGDDVRTVTVAPGATAEVRFGDPDETLEVVLSPPPVEPGVWRLGVRDAAGATRVYPVDSSGTATVPRPEGGALLSLLGQGVTIEVGTLTEDAVDPTIIERRSGVLTAQLPSSLDAAGPVWLELVDIATGRRAAEITARPGSELRVPFLADGVYELRGGGRSLATASVIDGGETDLGEIR